MRRTKRWTKTVKNKKSKGFFNDKNRNSSLEEEFESDDLESEEEMEYMTGDEPEGKPLE